MAPVVGGCGRRCCLSWNFDAVLQRVVPRFQAVPKHQSVERDLAVVVAERVTHAQLMAAIRSAVPETLLRDAVLFDVYRPKPVKGADVAPATGLAPGEHGRAPDAGQRRGHAHRGRD